MTEEKNPWKTRQLTEPIHRIEGVSFDGGTVRLPAGDYRIYVQYAAYKEDPDAEA